MKVAQVQSEPTLRDFAQFEGDNIKNEAILPDFLQNWQVN